MAAVCSGGLALSKAGQAAGTIARSTSRAAHSRNILATTSRAAWPAPSSRAATADLSLSLRNRPLTLATTADCAGPRLNHPPRKLDEVTQPANVFAFADAVHQDFSLAQFYEPHSVSYRRQGKTSGAGHFRHTGRANVAYLDGHAAALAPPPSETFWLSIAGSDVVNLDTTDGPDSRYGFVTWTGE